MVAKTRRKTPVTEEPRAGVGRPAGPEATRDPLPQRDKVNEASDQSLPASDPPVYYARRVGAMAARGKSACKVVEPNAGSG